MSSAEKKSSVRKTRSHKQGGAMGVPEPEAEHPVHDGDVEPPSTPTAIEQRLTQRILAFGSNEGARGHLPPRHSDTL